MFCQGLSRDSLDRIKVLFNLRVSSLPIRYLGLPLSSKQLSVADCDHLIVLIKKKLDSWTNNFLSLAGRLSLISSVISGIIGFWSSAFILPRKVIKKINSLSSSFLWHGKTGSAFGAKVAWSSLSLPKGEGGLGIKDAVSWNNACVMKLIWLLFFQADSIWVAWIRRRYLSKSSFWALNDRNPSFSWMFRKILKLRSKAFQFLSIKIGRGESTFFWWDPWTPFGSLHAFLGDDGPSRLGIPLTATVSDLWCGSGWSLPPARTERQVLLHTYLLSLRCSASADIPVWSIRGSPQRSFSLRAVWNEIRPTHPEVLWASLLWHKAGIARHQAITWLFLLNRTPTLDRMIGWGYKVEGTCLLCSLDLETRDHLFFRCPFSAAIWRRIKLLLHAPMAPMEWNHLLSWFNVTLLDSSKKLAMLQGWQGAIYEIWRERNRRLHNGVTLPYGRVFNLIFSSTKDKCRAMVLLGSSRGDPIFHQWSHPLFLVDLFFSFFLISWL
ncbi:unnamed protein product [Microthlaspi erraticum]|uniref:Reverse transcriptase zinc-binding domain-containing protein n=1 Tax=Microthlaspi erraticum TaxID=1685480 RepID=A0A6D2I040_9BRAS|nr:unnamed protein product [Microthlaspi erraticum]